MTGHRRRASDSLASVWDVPKLAAAFSAAAIKPQWAVRLWHLLLKHPSVGAAAVGTCWPRLQATPAHPCMHPQATWADLQDLPKAAVALLDAQFCMHSTKVVRCSTSADNETVKLLIELADGQQVESVIMCYDTRGVCAAQGWALLYL